MKEVRTYSVKEVSKIIHISANTIKQWEKDFSGFLEIPRSKQGARLYTNSEMNQLIEIKAFFQNQLSSEEIRNILQEKLHSQSDPLLKNSNTVLEKDTPSQTPNEIAVSSTENFFAALEQYKQTFLSEIKNEIKMVVRTEVIEEVKKEISKGTLNTVKTISDSIYKSGANTVDEIKELSYTIQKSSQITAETYKSLERCISDQSLETSEEFYTMAKQIAETSEGLSNYIDATNNEISGLTQAIERDREYFMEEREQFRHEIRQRELAFQSMLSSYRDTASARGKKRWKFW